MYASIKGGKPDCLKMRNESKERWDFRKKGTIGRPGDIVERFEQEHICWDPKDSELCLSRAKSEETLMEARRDVDVQIALQTWV